MEPVGDQVPASLGACPCTPTKNARVVITATATLIFRLDITCPSPLKVLVDRIGEARFAGGSSVEGAHGEDPVRTWSGARFEQPISPGASEIPAWSGERIAEVRSDLNHMPKATFRYAFQA
jgi:hypothetical protein